MLIQFLEKPAQLGQQNKYSSTTPGSRVWLLMVMTVLPEVVAVNNRKDHDVPKKHVTEP